MLKLNYYCTFNSALRSLCILLFILNCVKESLAEDGIKDKDIIVLTIATNKTEGYERYLRSANVFGINVKTIGMGVTWFGGEMVSVGGGQKVNMLRKELDKIITEDSDREKIVIFTDSYDVIFLGRVEEIVGRFLSMEDTRVLFSAEAYCWPNASLKERYPKVEKGHPYLNSGMFMGYLKELYGVVSHQDINDDDDDQLYYSNIYVDEDLRNKFKIKLDHTSYIFQNLFGAYDEIELHAEVSTPYITNKLTGQTPMVFHGNGVSKDKFNSFANYLAGSWSPDGGCKLCQEKEVKLDENNLPSVLLSIFIEQPTPFLEEFFRKINSLNYPQNKLHLLIRNNAEYHTKQVNEFVAEHKADYASLKEIKVEDAMKERDARNVMLELALAKNVDYLFVVDAVAHLDNKDTLLQLLKTGVNVVAPLMKRYEKMWSNFWGALSKEGFYERSDDYMAIAQMERRGIWNVPFINSCYLVKMSAVKEYSRQQLSYTDQEYDADMTFCRSLRSMGIFMYVMNFEELGHLVEPDTFDTSLTNPELYQIFENKYDWEQRYIHPDYPENFNQETKPRQVCKRIEPCPDVYWFPMTTMRFCKEYIEMVEAFGQWSDGSNSDARLEGGYEAVPTRDIHTNQVGFERHWLYILQQYVRPLQEMVFIGYFHDPPRSLMNFVVRYKPDEQPSLRPHHDSSTYTINLALNTPGVDYKGGGCHFLRYNCSVLDTKPGWLLMHPGRLTHYHEGLLVTEGVRYIMISFVDP